MPTPLIPDIAVFQRKLATLPLVTYQAGETVLSAASTTGRLLILKEGAVAVVKEGVEIARVTERGAVFGELSVLLSTTIWSGGFCGGPAGAVGRAKALRYDAFEPELAGMGEDGRAVVEPDALSPVGGPEFSLSCTRLLTACAIN
jgi:CRP-like cAMP-binding protein